MTWAVVPAAGRGTRFGAETPKQYLMLAGRPVTVLTTDFDADTDVSLQRMAEAGLLSELMVVRNLFEDAGLYGGTPTGFFTSAVVAESMLALDREPDVHGCGDAAAAIDERLHLGSHIGKVRGAAQDHRIGGQDALVRVNDLGLDVV